MIDIDSEKLIQAALRRLEEKYNPPVHSVAAALLTSEGEIITAVNIDHFSGFVCAETAALTIAINANVYDFEAIVAVRKRDDNGSIIVANMCGKCRQIFSDYTPNIKVIIAENESIGLKQINEILPYPFTRQRDKIQSALKGRP